MRDHASTLQGDTKAPPLDLGPPEFLEGGSKQLTAIMQTYETSFTAPKIREADFETV